MKVLRFTAGKSGAGAWEREDHRVRRFIREPKLREKIPEA